MSRSWQVWLTPMVFVKFWFDASWLLAWEQVPIPTSTPLTGEPKLGEWCKVKGAGVRAWETSFIKWVKDYMFAQVTWPLLHYCRWARELLAGINPPYSTFLTRECADARLTLSTGSSAGKGVRFRQHDSMSLTPVVTGSQAWAGQVRLFKLDKVALILSIIFF